MHIIDFFIVAFVMFLVIKGINRLKEKRKKRLLRVLQTTLFCLKLETC